ncbi:major facilitator superfamily MFS_1 [Paenibacillus lactis 154]|uniref:Major facilitator superfamily MFS_1 n=1 Tax=Paenibacillus lactis 154 TaxID=743719 RepID=G4HCD2_9BACL|nr:major facilitator superfamily MFS_1 [Paenibacillus lactis 154]
MWLCRKHNAFGLKGMTCLRNMDKDQPSLTSLKLCNFFIYGTMVIFTGFFQLYLQDIGMSKIEIGSLMAIAPFVSIFANPFWGYWGDRTANIKRVLLMMMTGTLLLVHFVFQANTYAMIYMAMILFYFFQTPMFSQTNSLILTYIDGTRHKFGSFRLWGSLGWALTAIAAGPVIDQLGSGRISIVFSIMLFVAAIFIFTLPGVQKTTGSATVTLKGLSQLFLNSYFVWFIVLGILVSIPNTANNTFMSLYILELGGTTQTVGLAIFFSSVFEVVIFLVLDRFLKRKIHVLVGCLAVVSLLFALRWLLMAEASSPVHVALIQLLHCVTFGGYFYVGVQLTMLFVPKPYRASGQAIYTLSWSGISGVVGGLAGGWMFQNFGAQTMYRTGMMLAIIGVIGFGWMWYNLHKHGYQPRQPDELPDDAEEEYSTV